MNLQETIRRILKESVQENIKILKSIAKKIANKLHCDRHGSCVHFAEIFVDEVNKQYPELLNDFEVIEGYVNVKFGDGIPQEHTWIKLNNGDIIDPTFSQFDKYDKNAQYSKKRTKVYSGQEYYDEGKEGSWFSERRKKLPSSVFKEEKRETIRRILKESDKELRFVYNPKNDRVIGFNIESEDELNNIIYDENGHNRGYGWGLQLKDNQSIKFDSLQDAQQWYQEKNGDRITKETQNSKYPELSFIALNLRKIDGLDYDIINRGSCFKFAKEISELGYNTFTFIFSNEDQEVIHVYIKLTNNLYFDATGFHTKKEIKQHYINGEDNEMYDSDISELNHYCNLDTYSALSTIPISNQLWKKVINVINKSRMNLQESIRRILREELDNLLNKLKPYLIEGKYLYHYTPTYNLDDIKEEGLIPRKNPNSFYKEGIEGIFLTNKSSLYDTNLPQDLMNLMDEYYENGEEDEKPIVRLTIDVTQLNPNKITWDDDYIMNLYKWNKAITDEDKIIESINIWGTISYKGLISPEFIINEDFDYLS